MKNYVKKILAITVCMLPLAFLLLQVPPASATAGWQLGYNLARDRSQLPEQQLEVVIFAILAWLLTIFTFISVIAFTVAGIMFLTSGGDAQQTEQAKKYVKYSIIGITVGLSGYVIIKLIDTFLAGMVQTQA